MIYLEFSVTGSTRHFYLYVKYQLITDSHSCNVTIIINYS